MPEQTYTTFSNFWEQQSSLTLPHFHVDQGPRVLIVGCGNPALGKDTFWNHPESKMLQAWMGLTSADISVPAQVGFFSVSPEGNSEDLGLNSVEILQEFPQARLILLLGEPCHHLVLRNRRKKSLEETVQAYDEFLPFFPLPDPRTLAPDWYDRNPWFKHTVLQLLRRCVAIALEKDRL